MKRPLTKFLKLTTNKWFRIFFFVLVLYLTFVLRAHNYDKTPTSNHLDEMLYAWSGLSLIQTGVPVSWSTLDYPDRAEVYRGDINYRGGYPRASVTLYKPWLDQPPVFSLIVGYFANLFGSSTSEFVPSSYIRFPVIFMSAITSIMIFLIARRLTGYWSGVLAMTVYAITPVILFGSRTAMPENFIAMLFTIMVYLVLKLEESKKFLYIIPIPFLIGLAGLSKPTGFLLLGFALFWTTLLYYRHKSIKKIILSALYLILLTAPFIGAFFWYGLHYDAEIFWIINKIQSSRPVGFSSLAWFFISPAFDTSILVDGWYVFCLLSAGFFIFRPKEGSAQMVSFAFIYWVLVVMISGGAGDLLPWYRFPAFPFLAILGAWGLMYVVEKANFYTSFLVAGLLLGSRQLLVNPFRPNIMPSNYRLVMFGLLSPSLLNMIFDKKILTTLTKIVLVLVIIVGVYYNVTYIYNHFELVCESLTCPFVPSTFLSRLHFPLIWRFFVLK